MSGWLWRDPEMPPAPPMPQMRLPAAVLAKASLRGYEHAWHPSDVPEAITAARECGLATVGGVAQFRIPAGTCELYWRSADARLRQPGEPWAGYVARSADEVLAAVQQLPLAEMVSEGLQWPEVVALRDAGEDVSEYLCFVLYFDAPGAE
jgi:hypothetical protein